MNKEKKLVIILPRGEAIKNFVFSGITDALREDYQVIFFSIIPNIEIKKYLKTKSDEFYELNEIIDKNIYATELKNILQIAHAKKINSVTGNLKILKDDLLSKKNIKSYLIRKVRKLIASFFASHNSLQLLTNKYIQRNFNNKNVLYYESLLTSIKPDIIFNASHIHNTFSLSLMYAAKKLSIKTAAFLFSWDNLTSQGRIIPDYDYYFTWNYKIKEDLKKIYPSVEVENIFVTGTPQFDFHCDEKFIDTKENLYAFLNIPTHKKIIIYSTGMAYYTPKEYLIVKEIEKILKKIDQNLQLVLRVYAKDDNTNFYKLRETTDIVIPDHYWELNHLTPTLKDIKLFNSLINHCTIGINVASTVSLDLAVLDKPIINIAFNPPNVNIYPNDYKKIYEFDHYKPIVNSGAISIANTKQELESQIKEYLSDEKLNSDKRKKLLENFFGKELKADKKDIFVSVFKSILS